MVVTTPRGLSLLVFLWQVRLEMALSPSSGTDDRRLLVVGLGRVGLDCAKAALGHFDTVYGTVRSMKGIEKDDGIRRVEFDPDTLRPVISDCTHALITVPLSKDPDPRLGRVFDEVQNLLPNNAWIGIISTTGVYGNHEGGWVSEDSPPLCGDESNAALYRDYEEDWKRRIESRGQRLSIFRCAGIYDSTRSALHTVYKSGLPKTDVRPPTTNDVTNRIHSVDIARAVLVPMLNNDDSHPLAHSRVYNLADDLPESRAVVLDYAAELLHSIGVQVHEPPPKTENSVRGQRRMLDRKLVSNQRLREELLPGGLLYPTFREGLKAILEDPSTPWQQQAQI